jgi:hypothetical protein
MRIRSTSFALAVAAALAAAMSADTAFASAATVESTPAETLETKPVVRPWYERVTISGLLFGDAYVVAAHHDPDIENQNGFWLRRGYLTFDFTVAEKWSARLRMEANSPGDFVTNSDLHPFVKDAYLEWKDEGHDLYLGISPSPAFDLVEHVWEYRAVEKTPLDLYRLASSRDFGVAYRGHAFDGKFLYHAMLGNGAGQGSETNEGKKGMLSLAFQATKQVIVEFYADVEDRPGSTDRSTYHAFVGFKGAAFHSGVEYASQDRQTDAGPDQTIAVGSVFGVWDFAEKLSLLARIDRSFDGNPEAEQIPYWVLANDTKFDLALVGLDYRIQRVVSLIPNIGYVAYRETDGRPAPDNDLIVRLTLSCQF